MRRRTASVGALALLVALPAILLAAAWLNRSNSVDGVTIRREAVLTEATARTVTDSRPAALRLSWEPGIELFAQPWNGTVTRLYAAPGDMLVPGDPILAIDGSGRAAPSWFAGRRPGQSASKVRRILRASSPASAITRQSPLAGQRSLME